MDGRGSVSYLQKKRINFMIYIMVCLYETKNGYKIKNRMTYNV